MILVLCFVHCLIKTSSACFVEGSGKFFKLVFSQVRVLVDLFSLNEFVVSVCFSMQKKTLKRRVIHRQLSPIFPPL